jgi:hypothetical protein
MKSLKNVTPEKVAAVLKLMRKGEQLTRQAERRRRTALVVWLSAHILGLGLMAAFLVLHEAKRRRLPRPNAAIRTVRRISELHESRRRGTLA